MSEQERPTHGERVPEGSGKQFAEGEAELDEVGNPADPDAGKGFARGQADVDDRPDTPVNERDDERDDERDE